MKYFEQIINSYQKSDFDLRNHQQEKSEHWKRFYNDADKFSLEDNIKNFRQDQILSKGLDDAHHTFSFETFMDIINELDEDFVFNNLNTKNV